MSRNKLLTFAHFFDMIILQGGKNVKDRLKTLRKELGLTQEKFAERLSMKRNSIANYEIGRNEPIDAVIALICKEFNVNETWLRTGTGEMFKPLSKNQIITDFAGDLIKEDDTFRKRLFEALAQLSESEWKALEILATKLSKKG